MSYPCSQFEYIATEAGNLKKNVESKHEGVRYPRPNCEYAAIKASHLKRHVENKHEGVRYPCMLQLQHNILTLSLLGYLKTRIRWGGGQFDPPMLMS